MRRASSLTALRWPGAFVLASALHAAAFAAVMTRWTPGSAPGSELVAVAIDLEPVAARATPSLADMVPLPDPIDAPPDIPVDVAALAEPAPAPPEPAIETPPAAETKRETPPLPQTPSPVVLPAPTRTASLPPKPVPTARPAAMAAAPARPAPQTAAPSAIPGREAQAARSSWQSRVVAELNRSKQYPAAARARAESGTALVRFSIDRGGRVLSADVARSSGSAALDAEASALVRRVSPLPAPPPEITGARITLSVPIRFDLR